MIVTSPASFRQASARLADAPWGPATAAGALLVSPVGFRLLEESRLDNRYMAGDDEVLESCALAEHAALVEAIRDTLEVELFAGDRATPDAVFPNNVFATVPGRLLIGRMRHPTRRREAARSDIRDRLTGMGYETIDLSQRHDLVAELTGPLVIDRLRGIGYCGLTERCDLAGARAMHEALGLRLTFVFDLDPGEYHTNVVLTIAAGRGMIVHAGSFVDPEVPAAIASVYGDRILFLSDAEKLAFVGNAIALSATELWMSARAAAGLRPESRRAIESWGFTIRSLPLDEIEKAGGSLRCCVAELF